jgi:hypothetical protein
MVSRASFLTELIHGSILFRCVYVSLARVSSRDGETQPQQLRHVACPGRIGHQGRLAWPLHQAFIEAAGGVPSNRREGGQGGQARLSAAEP